MDSSLLLEEVRRQLHQGSIDPADLRSLLDEGAPGAAATSRLSSILYYVGGGVVFMGLIILIGQEWRSFGSGMKVFVTLGSAMAAFMSGVLLDRRPGALGAAFFLISALVMPLGVATALEESGVRLGTPGVPPLVAGLLTVVYAGAWWLFRRKVLLLAGLVFGTSLFFLFTDWLVMAVPVFPSTDFHAYRFLAMGLSYMFIGHGMPAIDSRPMQGWLYGVGVLMFLGAALVLGGWKPDQNWFWEAVYPGLVFVVLYLSIRLRSRSFLVFGALGLGSFLSKITAQYFGDSLGWPLALVLMGFLLMGVAYLALTIRNRYLRT